MTQQIFDQRVSPPSVLTIAGSDSGGGAGIQADLKTFAAHGLHGTSAIAALTAQNTRGVFAIHVPPAQFLQQQLAALFDDFPLRSTKIGMLADEQIIAAVAAALDRHQAANVVLDPVMIASSGAQLLADGAISSLRLLLIPRAAVLTPNLPEAEALLGAPIRDAGDMLDAAHSLLGMGCASVLLKGGHLASDELVDVFLDAEVRLEFRHPRLSLEAHGTGCTLSSAIAAQLALGRRAPEACRLACDYVHGALQHAWRPGKGTLSVLDHFWEHRR